MAILQAHAEPKTEKQASGSPHPRWYFAFFVVSGFCGLVYEVVWLRLAMAAFGVNTALISIVVSVFMAGLALGSWFAGMLMSWTDGSDARSSLRVYAAVEFLVGISSIGVPLQLRAGRLALQHIRDFAGWQSSHYYVISGVWLALSLIPWCACMGATFPILIAVIQRTALATSKKSFSYLYVANILGALVGTLASAFALIELFGFMGTLCIAGLLNALIAISAYVLSHRAATSEFAAGLASKYTKDLNSRRALYGFSPRMIPMLLFTTGFASMGMEVIWIRQFTPYLGNVVYAFAGILAVYLLATFAGSNNYRSWSALRDISESASKWISLALFAVVPLVAVDPLLKLGDSDWPLLRLSVIALFCGYCGFLTPLLVDFVSEGDPTRAGSAYAVNVLGCILGPLVAAFWLLPWLGERRGLFALSVPLFLIAAIAVFRKQDPEVHLSGSRIALKLKFMGAVSAGVLLFFVSHDYETAFPVRQVRRDYTATVIAAGTGSDRELFVNGVGMTKLTPHAKYMVHLPMAYLSKPAKNGLVICFGMGTSFRSMVSWGIPVTAVDLVPSVPRLFGYFHEDAEKVLSSRNTRIVVDDGRRFLEQSSESYDVIVVDPPPPPAAAGSSLLYSREFYDVIKKHLQPGGILQLWYPSIPDVTTAASVAKTITSSFSYVRAVPAFDNLGIHYLASMQPIPRAASSTLATHFPASAAADFIEWGPSPTVEQQLQKVLPKEIAVDQVIAAAPRTPIIQDDDPINEYYLLRRLLHFHR